MSPLELEQRLMDRLQARRAGTGPPQLRPAAVLIPLVRFPEGHRLLLTKRSATLRRQPGDISFPGGAIDPEDGSALEAALRESQEEVGLRAEDVTVLGQMDERGTVTGFCITPFVGAIEGPYPFRPNLEVGELLEVPLTSLLRPGVLHVEMRGFRGGTTREVYHYQYGEHDIWGITGQLMKDFLELFFPEGPEGPGDESRGG